jgi:hypothetical protein
MSKGFSRLEKELTAVLYRLHKNTESIKLIFSECDNDKSHEYQRLRASRDIDVHTDEYNDIFEIYCEYGYLELAKRSLNISNKINIHADDDYVFRAACTNGHLEIAKWLLDISNNKSDPLKTGSDSASRINIHSYGDEAFRNSCENGHIEVAKWLFDISNNALYSLGGINVHAYKGRIFFWSCYKQYVEVAKWIYSFGGIHIDDGTFVFNYENECVDMMIFLLSTGEYHDYEGYIIDNKVTKILFDASLQAGQIGNRIKLSNKLTDKYMRQKQLIMSDLACHLIPDIAELVYHYV